MTPFRPEIALRAVGTALAGLSAAFAVYMLAYGEGKTRVNGLEYMGIFAQPRGSMAGAITPGALPSVLEKKAVDMATTGSLDRSSAPAPAPRPVEIIAARADRVWLRVDGTIRAASPGDDIPRIGQIAAIVPRDGGWALLDDKGATLLSVGRHANGVSLFTRKLIFE